MKSPMDETAETLFEKFRQALSDAAGGPDPSDRSALQAVEEVYGAQATRTGRRLSDLLAGSPAWDIFEKPARSRLPRLYVLCGAEPVLRAMRESGELDAREMLLKQRDTALAAVWEQGLAWEQGLSTDEERWAAAEAIHEDYAAGVRQTAEAYRAHYEILRRAVSDRTAPLAAPNIRSRVLLQPPIMALLFRACHEASSTLAPAEREFVHGGNTLRVQAADSALLDAHAWDSAALAGCAFFARTDGTQSDTAFPFFFEDYFSWRGVDPRKRSQEMRRQIAARIELLCSDRMQICSETPLWRTDLVTGKRKKTTLRAEGSFLVKHARLFRSAPGSAEPEVIGYLLSLGSWAGPLIEERAMLGIYPKRLAEYDLQRQQWERRIGWYLVFQMNNQGSRMIFQELVKDGKAQMQVTPQHPLKMKTVLAGSHVVWEETARTNPGKVIRQWNDALETLRRDGVIGPYPCLDGLPDGSDLPRRGRLAAMLERRTQFVPGKELLLHLRAKRSAAERLRPL